MDDFLIEHLLEEPVAKKKKSKGFGSYAEDNSSEEVVETQDEAEIVIEAPVEETPVVSLKRHDHSIRPMRRTKPVPKRGEKAATRVRR